MGEEDNTSTRCTQAREGLPPAHQTHLSSTPVLPHSLGPLPSIQGTEPSDWVSKHKSFLFRDVVRDFQHCT